MVLCLTAQIQPIPDHASTARLLTVRYIAHTAFCSGCASHVAVAQRRRALARAGSAACLPVPCPWAGVGSDAQRAGQGVGRVWAASEVWPRLPAFKMSADGSVQLLSCLSCLGSLRSGAESKAPERNRSARSPKPDNHFAHPRTDSTHVQDEGSSTRWTIPPEAQRKHPGPPADGPRRGTQDIRSTCEHLLVFRRAWCRSLWAERREARTTELQSQSTKCILFCGEGDDCGDSICPRGGAVSAPVRGEEIICLLSRVVLHERF